MAYIGEIQLFAFDYAPMDWALCNGAMLNIRDFPIVFAIIGTTYGGNGRDTFQLPNFTGRAACGQGSGNGLTPRKSGDFFGANSVKLSSEQMAPHSHGISVYRQTDTKLLANIPAEGSALTAPSQATFLSSQTTDVDMGGKLSATGADAEHENRQPLLALNFCIALRGDPPSFD